MSRAVSAASVPAREVERILEPRRGFVVERSRGDGSFEAVQGPFVSYRRAVEVEAPGPDGAHVVRQTVEYRLDLPYFGWLFALPVRRHLSRLVTSPTLPWWGPPEHLDHRAALSLDSLCALSLVLGYLGTLPTQTMTFAAREFGNADTAAQANALTVLRADVVFSVVLVALADRRGRRRILLLTSAVGCILTATGALVPSLAVLAGSQVVARGFVTAAVVLLSVVAAEEMPAGARAYAVGLLALAGGLGAGVAAVGLLPLADVGRRAWRLLFAAALLGLLLVRSVGRRLPESRRFGAAHPQAALAGHGRRFWLLAASAFLLQLFFVPAAQFANEYLREERGFSARRISLFTLATATPAGIGVVLGGRLAERGRRLVGAVGLVGGVGATVLMYVTAGWPVWAWSVLGSVVGGATIPALGVYGPELFPTSLRGRANGVIIAVARVGSVVGLQVAGRLSSDLGSLGPAIALLALGPAVLAVLVVLAYPETAHRELEELNPEDAPPK